MYEAGRVTPMMDDSGLDTSPELAEVMERVRAQEQQVERIQRDVEAMRVTGHSRDNEVSATVQGNGRFTEISIDEYAARQYGPYELGPIVLEAVNDALDRMAEATAAQYAPVLEMAQSATFDR
jgi:nucleoid-associated protein EbfC